jgi:iron(II)-dependent oxidoreductase
MDMAGNVSEYCTDKYDPKYYSTGPDTNPVCTAVPFETGPVIRGGTWCCSGELLRSANRNYGASFLDGWADAGFRCAVTR